MPLIHVSEVGPEAIETSPGLSIMTERADPRLRVCLFINQAGTREVEAGELQVCQQLCLDMHPDEAKEAQWYLEDYAIKDSFERTRAKKAKEAIENWAKRLITSVNWDALVPASQRNEPLVLQILEDQERQSHVFWEALESPSLLEHVPCPGVHVLRSSPADGGYTPSRNEPAQGTGVENGGSGQGSQTKILVLSARPGSDEDIPHRLVSRVILSKVRESGSDMTSLRIVRPGTWQAFKTELESKPAGYYQIVHIDVHGVEDAENRVYLAFIKADESRLGIFGPHRIPAADIARLLAASGVKWVIVNACRSARGSAADQNIALSMIKAGLGGCVAMSHSIVSRAVEIFTAALYDGLLLQGLSLEDATYLGRMALLAETSRISGFSDHVDVHDWIVPVVYINSSETLQLKWPKFRSKLRLPLRERDFRTEPLGRESDILSIELSLLTSRRPVLLVGPAGVGKTMLLLHLAEWWTVTGLVTGALIFQFPNRWAWNETAFYQQLHELLLPGTPFEGPEAAISHLRNHKILLIIDCLESIELMDRSAMRKFWRDIMLFLELIFPGKSLTILVSRMEEKWLYQHTVTYQINGLGTIGAMQLMRSILGEAAGTDETPVFDVESSLHALEQLHKLVDGHPLAIRILVLDMLKRKKDPLEYLIEFLGGGTVQFDDWMAVVFAEGYRCLLELAGIVGALLPRSIEDVCLIEILSLFSRRIPEALMPTFFFIYSRCYSKNTFTNTREACEFAERIMDMSESMGRPARETAVGRLLADLYSQPEPEDQSTRFGGLTIDDALMWLEGLGYEAMLQHSPALPLIKPCLDRVLGPLKKAGYLTTIELHRIPKHLRGNGYLSVHPLLPLVLRSSGVYEQNILGVATAVQQAFTHFHTYRVKQFPWSYMYYNDAWTEPRELLSFEYANFLGAAFTFLRDSQADQGLRLVHIFTIRMLRVVHRCVEGDAARLRIVHSLWDKALNFLLAQEARLEDGTPRDPYLIGLARALNPYAMGSQARHAQPSDPTSSSFELPVAICLFSIRNSAMDLVGQLIILKGRRGCPQPRDYLQIAERLYKKLKEFLTLPSVIKPEERDAAASILEHSIYNCRETVNPTSLSISSLPELWARREAAHRTLIDLYGVETYPSDQRGYENMPFSLVSSSALVRNFMPAMLAIRRDIDEGRLDEARRRVDEALRLELYHDANEEANKAALLNFRAEINERRGEWEDARRNREEAKRMELLARGLGR
ncbi:hypothetical protein NEMBOFW57_008390 [Staphylotrichum longicolle]|uniref:CHAT domain-containing protein n=1 Tax=Staphylotrichum longicolle TaxID=669026 RepID=A0AAD4EV27_9PEZI|nr:hypothetical protein NEMBOFW57_008390 [Staphylotrichum longicolle]